MLTNRRYSNDNARPIQPRNRQENSQEIVLDFVLVAPWYENMTTSSTEPEVGLRHVSPVSYTHLTLPTILRV